MWSAARCLTWLMPWLLLLGSIAAAAAPNDLATVAVTRAELPRIYRLDGVVEAIASGTLSAQTSGSVLEVNFDVDDFVGAGDLILRIDDTRQQAAVREAEANLEAAAAQHREAALEHGRIRGVFKRQAVSKAQMDRATAALERAQANEQAAEAALQKARKELEFTQVRAPYSGIVTKRLIEVGETVQPGTPLMSGLSLDDLRIRVEVPQALIGSIRAERRAQAKIGERWIEVQGVTVFPVADPRSATFEVRLRLPKGVEGLFPGMYAKVGFVVGSVTGLVIPRSAVVRRSEVIAVYVVDPEGRVSLRHIRLGRATEADQLSVLTGLSAGERVASDPVAAGIRLKAQRTAQVDHE